MFFNSRIVGGVNLVGIDDAYHQAEESQLLRLKKEVAKGKKTIAEVEKALADKNLDISLKVRIKNYLNPIPEDTILCLWGIGNHGGGPSKKDLDMIYAMEKDCKAQADCPTKEQIHR